MVPHTVNGLPTHALAVHAAVVAVPLAALLALLFVFPRTRSWAAIPMPIVTVVALLALYVARASGFNLRATIVAEDGGAKGFASNPVGHWIGIHESRANVLFYLMIVFTVITLVVFYLYRYEHERFVGAVYWASCALLVIGALVVVVQVIRVGDAGARAVWNPSGNQNYGLSAISSRFGSV